AGTDRDHPAGARPADRGALGAERGAHERRGGAAPAAARRDRPAPPALRAGSAPRERPGPGRGPGGPLRGGRGRAAAGGRRPGLLRERPEPLRQRQDPLGRTRRHDRRVTGAPVKLAWFSPLPPMPSGIADYTTEILPYIAAEAAVDVFCPSTGRIRKPKAPPGSTLMDPAGY